MPCLSTAADPRCDIEIPFRNPKPDLRLASFSTIVQASDRPRHLTLHAYGFLFRFLPTMLPPVCQMRPKSLRPKVPQVMYAHHRVLNCGVQAANVGGIETLRHRCIGVASFPLAAAGWLHGRLYPMSTAEPACYSVLELEKHPTKGRKRIDARSPRCMNPPQISQGSFKNKLAFWRERREGRCRATRVIVEER